MKAEGRKRSGPEAGFCQVRRGPLQVTAAGCRLQLAPPLLQPRCVGGGVEDQL